MRIKQGQWAWALLQDFPHFRMMLGDVITLETSFFRDAWQVTVHVQAVGEVAGLGYLLLPHHIF